MTHGTSYDYVIVGAGSAGCVLAARLSEDPSVSVLVLEAGPPDDADLVKAPAAFSYLFKTSRDWNFNTTEQKQANSRRIYWPRGKTLGGSSSINAMIYIRGNAVDYDHWRDSYGCVGWGYSDLLPYFKRAEDNARGASEFHGADGPLRVEDLRYVHDISRRFLDAAAAAGHALTDDFNGASQEGFGLYQVTQQGGRRWSAADAYLRPAMERPNVQVRTDVLVNRLVLRGGRAEGVEVTDASGTTVVRVEREVIVSAGAVGTPHLLMRSGIGPAHHLREVGVDVELDSPGVGQNLSDHPVVPLIWRTQDARVLHDSENPLRLMQWQVSGRGPMSSNVAEAGGFLRTSSALPAPDIQWHVAPAEFDDEGLRDPSGPGFTAAPTLVAVNSRGQIRLRTADPRHAPLIDPDYFGAPEDLDAMVEGLRITLDIAGQSALRKHLAGPLQPRGVLRTEDDIREHARRRVQTIYHPVGTASMGVDERAVVDLDLRVRGIEGLRVVDASVMPVVPRGNTNAPTIAIAERAADLIRGRAVLAPV